MRRVFVFAEEQTRQPRDCFASVIFQACICLHPTSLKQDGAPIEQAGKALRCKTDLHQFVFLNRPTDDKYDKNAHQHAIVSIGQK
jgi:hypothetical protein